MSGWKSDINTQRRVGLKRGKPKSSLPSKPAERKRLKKELDKVARETVFMRDENRCVTCETTEALQWSHYYRRGPESTRWYPMNSAVQCAGCHFRYHKGMSKKYDRWMLKIYGQEKLDELEHLHHSGKKLSILELDIMLQERKNTLARLLLAKGDRKIDAEIPF